MKRYLNIIIIILAYFLLCSWVYAASSDVQIKILGVPDSARQNIEERLDELHQSYGHDSLSPAEVHDFFKKSPENIRKALEPFGYFKAQVTAQQLIYRDHQWSAYFLITPGPLLPITQVDLALTGAGENDRELRKFMANFPLKPGQPFQTEVYEKAKNDLFQTANNQGYLQATLTINQVRINLRDYTAIVIIHLNTGPRFYFGLVKFNQTPFSDAFLQRFVTIHEGELFSSKTLLDFQQDLNKSRYFQQVIVTPDLKHTEGNYVPVDVSLAVPKAKQYNFGFGYGTFTGPRVTVGADFRRVGGNGQHLTTQIKWSSVLSGLAAKYFIPGKNPLTDQYAISADAQKFSPKNGQSFSEKFSGSYMKTLQEWQHTISLNYLIERFQVEKDPSEVSRIFYPSYALSRIKMDDLINPRNGTTFNFNVQGASEHILSATNFIQSEIKGKYIVSPTKI